MLADGNTRPLRSSPLAGPALNPPALPTDQSLMITSSRLSHASFPKSCQCLDSASNQPFCDSCTKSRQRAYPPITGGIRSSERPQSLHGLDTGRATAFPDRTDPLQNPIPPRSPKYRPRPKSPLAVSALRHSIVETAEQAEFDEAGLSASTFKQISNSSRNSSATEFGHDVTPRFSRLGLSGSAVVMPLSAKEHHRLSTSRTPRTSPSSPSPIDYHCIHHPNRPNRYQ